MDSVVPSQNVPWIGWRCASWQRRIGRHRSVSAVRPRPRPPGLGKATRTNPGASRRRISEPGSWETARVGCSTGGSGRPGIVGDRCRPEARCRGRTPTWAEVATGSLEIARRTPRSVHSVADGAHRLRDGCHERFPAVETRRGLPGRRCGTYRNLPCEKAFVKTAAACKALYRNSLRHHFSLPDRDNPRFPPTACTCCRMMSNGHGHPTQSPLRATGGQLAISK